MRTLVIYLHIPKTGGTSMVETLTQAYGGRNKAAGEAPLWWSGIGVLKTKPGRVPECLAGHLPYGIHRFFPNCKPKYITMLRHPVDRVISLFHHKQGLAGGGGKNWKELGCNENTSLEDYIYRIRDAGAKNAMTAQLSGMKLNDYVEGLRPVTLSDYEAALQNLLNFEAVGVTERMADTVRLFAHRLNWPIANVFNENSREHPSRLDYSNRIISEIINQNWYDLLLYQKAMDLLERGLADVG